eukprot:scaffold7086_cov120-Isochrysis_galbana.AAC.8
MGSIPFPSEVVVHPNSHAERKTRSRWDATLKLFATGGQDIPVGRHGPCRRHPPCPRGSIAIRGLRPLSFFIPAAARDGSLTL